MQLVSWKARQNIQRARSYSYHIIDHRSPAHQLQLRSYEFPSRQQSEPPLCYRPPQFYEELPGGDDSSTRAPLVPSREDMSRLNMPYFLNRRDEMIQLDIATCDDVTMCYSEGEYLVRTVQVMMAVILSAYIVLFAQIQMLVRI
mmetsp:Transcript_15298/g.36710  ORF Transcript_15298/g.36710 Transcript_15298/m.36710 type:complete len:144 (+) Transcript_15298:119-550(+)